MTLSITDLSYLMIEVFIVGIEDRPLRDVVTERGAWSLFNECFTILEDESRDQREGEVSPLYSRRIVVGLRCSFTEVELIGQFLWFTTDISCERRFFIIGLTTFLHFRLLHKPIKTTRNFLSTLFTASPATELAAASPTSEICAGNKREMPCLR